MQIRDLRYNDRITAFEASVSVTRDGAKLRFPCRVFGPAPSAILARSLDQ